MAEDLVYTKYEHTLYVGQVCWLMPEDFVLFEVSTEREPGCTNRHDQSRGTPKLSVCAAG